MAMKSLLMAVRSLLMAVSSILDKLKDHKIPVALVKAYPFIQEHLKKVDTVGSGWVVDRVELFWLDIASYEPFQGGSYIPLSSALGNKRVMVNKDDSCFRRALKLALLLGLRNPQNTPNILKKD